MTDNPNTNTAARELAAELRSACTTVGCGGHRGYCDPHQWADRIEALTQQQGGEQEAGVVDSEMLKRAMRADFNGVTMRDALMAGTDWDVEVLTAALTAALQAGSPT